MKLNSQRLLLSEIGWEDLDDVHRLNCHPEVDEFNTLGIPANKDETREIMRQFVEDRNSEIRKQYFWKITAKNSGEFLGVAGMFLSADKFKLGEIFFKLLPQSWGKGFATEVAKTLVYFGFDELKLHKMEAGVATENIRSIRVLEKVGMTREGLRRKILPIRGEWKDNYHYAIVEDDPRDY